MQNTVPHAKDCPCPECRDRVPTKSMAGNVPPPLPPHSYSFDCTCDECFKYSQQHPDSAPPLPVAHPYSPSCLCVDCIEYVRQHAPAPPKPVPGNVDHPPHYTAHPSGVECIQITEHMGFNLGNAFKYIWRCDLKKDAIEDLEKAVWYVQREIAKRKAS